MSYPLEAICAMDQPVPSPHMQAYVDRLHDRDGWKKALERGGPYDIMPR